MMKKEAPQTEGQRIVERFVYLRQDVQYFAGSAVSYLYEAAVKGDPADLAKAIDEAIARAARGPVSESSSLHELQCRVAILESRLAVLGAPDAVSLLTEIRDSVKEISRSIPADL